MIARLRAVPPRRALAAGVLAALLAAGALAVWSLPGRPPAAVAPVAPLPGVPQPPGFLISPAGDEVEPLTPIRVTYPGPVALPAGPDLLHIDPQPPGTYTWVADRTLQFEPEYPGLLRGHRYTLSVAAQPGVGVDQPAQLSFTTAGKLMVEHTIPQDRDTEIPLNAQVLVQFSRSVAPLTLLRERPEQPVLLSAPPITGAGEWLNTSLYRFTPDSLRPFTTYDLTIVAGLTSAADGVLAADHRWSFRTAGPALVAVSPKDGATDAGPQEPVIVRFTQPMRRSDTQAAITLTPAGGDPVPLRAAWSDGDTTLTLTPLRPLENLRHVVAVPMGLPGAGGGATRFDGGTSFTPVGRPGVAFTSPADGASNAQRFGALIRFTNPMDRVSVEDRLTLEGVEASRVRFFWSEGDRSLRVSAALAPVQEYAVTLAPGALDRFGQLAPGHRFAFTTGALPAAFNFALPGRFGPGASTFMASAEPVLYYHTVNVPKVTFRLHRITAQQFATGPLRSRSGPVLPTGTPLREWTADPGDSPNQLILSHTSLSGGGPLPTGYYAITALLAGAPSGIASHVTHFSVVDTLLVAKQSHDEVLVWALDQETGAPVAGATLEVVGLVGNPLTATTDASGVARFRNVRGDARPSFTVTVASPGRFGLVRSDWQHGSEPWQLGIPQEQQPRAYVGYIYTDRPLYRPGEEVHFKGVLRADNDASYSIPAPQSITVAITREQATVWSGSFTLSDFGTFAGTFPLAPDAVLGDHRIRFWTGPAVRSRAGWVSPEGGFQVLEFRKPEFEVSVRAGKADYVSGETVSVAGEAAFFFGGAVAGAEATWSVEARPAPFRAAEFPRYSFVDRDYANAAVVRNPVRGRGAGTTDGTGTLRFTIPAEVTGNEGPQSYELGVVVTDQNQQVVAGTAYATVHPAAVYVGIRPERYTGVQRTSAPVQLAAVGVDGAPVAQQRITVRAFRREWISVKEEKDGARQYRSEPRDTLEGTFETVTGADGRAAVTFAPAAGGSYRLVAEAADRAGRTNRAASYLWVSGPGQIPWEVTNNDSVALVADSDEYAVGDVAEVLVPAPFPGMQALVTVERGGILATEVRQLQGTSDVLRIPITTRHVPNVFVSVVLYRPPTAEDDVPRYKVGYVKLPVSNAVRALKVSIQADRGQTRPGERVRYTIRVTDHEGRPARAELSMAVVDKALLSLVDERTPSGLRVFWFERGLGVVTASSASVLVNRSNDVITAPLEGGKGGDGLDAEQLRQDFRNTAHWSAALDTGDDGVVEVEVTMPDNLTTWNTQVRAVSGDASVGEGTHELLSTRPLIVRPALPRFLRNNDAVQLRALVRNNTNAAVRSEVRLTAEGFTLRSNAPQSVVVPAGGSMLVEWAATAPGGGTEATIGFAARTSTGLEDAVSQKLPLHSGETLETAATGGVVRTEPVTEAVYLPGYALAQGGSLELTLQPTLGGSLEATLEPLQPRSWHGTREVAQRLITTAAVRRATPAVRGPLGLGTDSALDRDVAYLLGAQLSDGGWNWCRFCSSDPRASTLALLALGEAVREGRTVPRDGLTRGASYLRSVLSGTRSATPLPAPDERARMLFALAAAGSPDRSLIHALYEQAGHQLTPRGRGYLVLALLETGLQPSEAPLSELLAQINVGMVTSANGNHWETQAEVRSSLVTTAVVLRALVRSNPQHPLLDETVRWLLSERAARSANRTGDDIETISGLAEYQAATGELGASYGYSAALNGNPLLAGAFSTGSAPVRVAAPLERLQRGLMNPLRLTRDATSPGVMYYTVALRYRVPARPAEAVNRGIAVSHEYSRADAPGKPVDRVRVGETVQVKVTVANHGDLNSVEVNDFFPGGLEPLDPRLKTTPVAGIARLQEERRRFGPDQPAGMCGAPWYPGYYSPFNQVQLRDNRVTLTAQVLPRGVAEYIYYARATTPGTFYVAPAHAEQTAFPEVFGRSDSSTFTVEP